jgi:hypothetical protein
MLPGFRRDGWSPARKARFLDGLATGGTVRAACARVGMSPQAAYTLRRRDLTFAHAWDAALVLARAHAETVLAERALHGIEEEIWFRGELVGTRRRFDARLMLAHLARLDRAADDEAARRHAGRFDELLAAAAAGEALGEGDPRCGDPPGLVFPDAGRDAFALAAVAAAREAPPSGRRRGRAGEWEAEQHRVAKARAAAEAEWDAARAAMLAGLDAVLAGGEERAGEGDGEGAEGGEPAAPLLPAPASAAAAEPPAHRDGEPGEAPPLEFKSLHPPCSEARRGGAGDARQDGVTFVNFAARARAALDADPSPGLAGGRSGAVAGPWRAGLAAAVARAGSARPPCSSTSSTSCAPPGSRPASRST